MKLFAMPKKPVGDHAVHYRAKSVFSSATVWFNVISALATILALPQLLDVWPNGGKIIALAVASVNVALRFWTVRPVAIVAPGKSKTVAVRKI